LDLSSSRPDCSPRLLNPSGNPVCETRNAIRLQRTLDPKAPPMKLRPIHQFKLPTAILGGDINAQGDDLIAACFDGVYRVNPASPQPKKLGSHESYASGACWIDESQFISAGYDGQLIWWNVEQSEPVRRVEAHQFWSWDLAISPDRQWVASCTGQYLAGGYKYEPAPETEPSVKVYRVADGQLEAELSHVPSVHTVCFSPDSQKVGAANLMGEVRIWDLPSQEPVATWQSEDFTSWGIIKSHCYIGGIHASAFHPDGTSVLVAGMGPMRDPMAGNGKQRWQEFAWQENPVRKVKETKEDQAGEGLMEALAIHPNHRWFLMGGRLRGGNWSAALFDLESGDLLASLKTGYRITDAKFIESTGQLMLVGTQGQPAERNDQGRFPDFGRVEIYEIVEDE